MRFQPLSLYKNESLETDALGNPINTLDKFWQADGIFSNWTVQEAELGQPKCHNQQPQNSHPDIKSYLEQADKVKFEGCYYFVKEVQGSGQVTVGASLLWIVMEVMACEIYLEREADDRTAT